MGLYESHCEVQETPGGITEIPCKYRIHGLKKRKKHASLYAHGFICWEAYLWKHIICRNVCLLPYQGKNRRGNVSSLGLNFVTFPQRKLSQTFDFITLRWKISFVVYVLV